MSCDLIKSTSSFSNILDPYLFEAVEKKRSLKSLFNQKANPNCLNDQGLPLIHFAYAKRNFQALKEIVDHPGSDRNAKSFQKRTVLHQACIDGNEEVVKILANTVEDICIWDEERFSPLTIAAFEGKISILEILCRRGNIQTSYASKEEAEFFFKELNLALRDACVKSDMLAIDLLIQFGASLHYSYSTGSTARSIIISKAIKHDSINATPVDPYTAEFVSRKVLALFSKNVECTSIEGQSFELGGWHSPSISKIISDYFELFSTVSSSLLSPKNVKKVSAAFSCIDSSSDIHKAATNIQAGRLVVISTGWKGHVISIVFYKNYLAITNRGPAPSRFDAIAMYRIDFQKVNESLIKEIFDKQEIEEDVSMDFFYFKLPQILSPRRNCTVVRDRLCEVIETFSPKRDRTGICTLASQKTALRYCLMLLAVEEASRFVPYEQSCEKAVSLYKEWSTFARIKQLQSYLSSHFGCSALHPTKGPHKKDPDLNLIKRAYDKVLKHMRKDPSPKAFRELNDRYGRTLQFIMNPSSVAV